MALPNTFSRRLLLAVSAADVYKYDEIPNKVRVQIVHVLNGTIGSYFGHQYSSAKPSEVWEYIYEFMLKELGVFHLHHDWQADKGKDFVDWMLGAEVNDYLDALEISMRLIDGYVRSSRFKELKVAQIAPDDAIDEINARLREGCVGYQFASGQIIRVDSDFTHAEVVIPALMLLRDVKFASAEIEFSEAHKAFREGRYEDSMVGSAKAFESVLKVIAAERSWPVQPTDPASKLLAAAFNAGFLSNLVQSGFTALRSMLESGVPTPRNKSAGHGAGTSRRQVPEHLAAFLINQAAASMLFLEAEHRTSS